MLISLGAIALVAIGTLVTAGALGTAPAQSMAEPAVAEGEGTPTT